MTPARPCAETGSSILVLGLGNSLLSDEGVGIHALEYLRGESGLSLVDGGTLSFSLLPLVMEAEGLMVVDAAALGLTPGAVRRFTGPRMDRFVRGGIRTAHEVGLKELLDLARLEDRLPRRRALIGVQPALLDWGTTLSDPVAAALPQACALVRATARRWQVRCAAAVPV